MSGRAFWAALAVVMLASVAGYGYTVRATESALAPRAAASLSGPTGPVEVRLTAGSRPVLFQVVAGQMRPDRPVYVYVDPTYPVLQTTAASAKGIYDHLRIALPEGGWNAPVKRVDAAALARVLEGEPDSLAVVAAGAMPDTLLGPNRDFDPVRSYLLRGGELVFVGDGLFFWSARQGQKTFTLADGQALVGWAGELHVLGANLVHSNTGDLRGAVVASSPVQLASELEVGFRFTERGAQLPVLQQLRGWDAGWDSTGPGVVRTSVAVVPVGQGRLVLFGSGLHSAETLVSDDVTRLLLSGADVAPPFSATMFRVPHLQSRQVAIAVPDPGLTGGVRLLVFDRNGFTYFHRSLVVPT